MVKAGKLRAAVFPKLIISGECASSTIIDEIQYRIYME